MNHSLEQKFRTAIVLGGGGAAGNAWLIGIVAGLFEAGLDVTKADLVVGTSAGSTAAAQITSASPTTLLTQILAAPLPLHTRPDVSGRGVAPTRSATNLNHTERLRALIAASEDVSALRRRLGAAALETNAASDRSAQWRATVATWLPSHLWPEQRMLITAVDARTGEPAVFDRHSGIDLVDAVAASCAGGGFAYRIGANQYIDGGYRSNAENADLAAGYARVLVLSPFGGRSLHPVEWGTHLATQVEHLRACGSRVETIFPDSNSRDLFAGGGNVMDLTTRASAAQAGCDQGRALAQQAIEFWV